MIHMSMTENPRSLDAEKGLDEKDLDVRLACSPNPSESDNSTPEETRDGQKQKASPSLLSRFLHKALRRTGSSTIENTPPPEGGSAWLIVFFSHMAGFNTFGIVNAYGILQAHYVATLHLPPSTVSWIGSLNAFFTLFLGAFSGRLSDMGYFHQVHVVGTFLQILGFFAASFSTNYWQILLSHGVCLGLGGGLLFVPSISIVSTYFSKNRALALALVSIGNSVGGLVFAAILQNVLPTLGYGWAMRICGFVVMASAVPALFVLRPRNLKRVKGSIIEWAAFRELEYSVFAAGMFFTFLGMWVPVFYLGSFGRDIIGIDNKAASSLILIINGVGIAGRVLPAFLASIFGPLNLMIPLTLLSAVILFCWTAVHTSTSVLIFDVFYGFVMAAGQGMLPPSLGSLTTDMSKMGVRFGMVFSICAFALLVGQPLAGALIEARGGEYLYAQVWSGSCMILGVVGMVVARTRRVGWRWRVVI